MTRSKPSLLVLGAFLVGATAPLPAGAEPTAAVEKPDADRAGTTDLDARIDWTQVTTMDDAGAAGVAFGDLRLIADVVSKAGLGYGLHLDGRTRKGFDDRTDDRATVHDAFVRLGEGTGKWQVDLGRQVVRPVGGAEVDGLRVTRRLGSRTSATLFGGLQPHPLDDSLTTDFATVGGGYEYLGSTANHAAGVVATWYQGQLDRSYLTQRGYLRLGPKLSGSSYAILDLPVGDGAPPIDPTSLLGTLRYRPSRKLDTTLALSHHHTIVPGRWWADWLEQKRREIGFVLDGEDPVGTRITSLRSTTNLHFNRTVTSYLKLRQDWRHTEFAQGYEAAAGLRLTPGRNFVDASYAYRDYFAVQSHLASIDVGHDADRWGAEAGLFLLYGQPPGEAAMTSYDLHGVLWMALGELLGTDQRIDLTLQYQGLFEPEGALHALFVQLGYRT